MVHTYQVTGMTCSSCESKVKSSLLMVENVVNVDVSKDAVMLGRNLIFFGQGFLQLIQCNAYFVDIFLHLIGNAIGAIFQQ